MDLKQASKKAVEQCMGIKNQEEVLIIYDESTKNIAESLQESSKIITSTKTMDLDEFRPILELPNKIMDLVKKSDVVMLIIRKKMGEDEFRSKIKNYCFDNKIRFVLSADMTEKIFIHGMKADYNTIKNISNKVLNQVENAKKIKITTKKGTDLTISLSDNNWVATYGDYSTTDQQGSNLPSGEVFTWPKKVDGIAIIDGILGSHFSKKYGLLYGKSLKLTIVDSFIQEVECQDKRLERDFKKYIEIDENSKRINELGIGTNIGIKKLFGIMVNDEKMPGVHIAIGNPCPNTCKKDIKSKVHCDMIMLKASIDVENKTIMKEGRFI